MATAKDQEFYNTLLQKLDDEDEEGSLVGNCELIQTECSSMEQEVGKNNNKNGSIIIDADGNYYYQSSNKTVKVEPIKKVSEVPVKAVVVPANNRKKTTQASSPPAKRTKLETSTSEKSKTKKNNTNETITSEIGNQEEVYEFDENEQDPDDPQNVTQSDYESKGVIKNVTKTAAKEAASYTCMICSYETNKKFLLSRHLKSHSDDRPHKCSVCERGFKTKASLINHRNTHLGYKPHACSSCDMAFTTSGELVRHVRYRHTHIKPHKCTECDYCSVEMSKLRRHMRCHTGERPYQCPHCTYASPDTFKLKRHMRIHTGEKPYECDICHARFTQSNSLKHHRLIHSVNDKPVFQCHLCPTTCGRKTDLRLHIKKLHNSDQPIPCKRCGKELPDRYTYKMHVKTHEGEKCYRCEYCPYASISQRHLESHVAIHLDTKPFVCEMCQKSFRQKALLARHMKMYHSDNYTPPPTRKKDHKCPHCNKLFAFNGNLIRHMEIHDPTSRLFEEKEILKIGRMKRVQPDGTVVMVYANNNLSKNFDGNSEGSSEENEMQQDEDEELQEEEEEYEVPEEYNEDNIQYVYEELEADEYEEQVGDEQYDNQQGAFDQKTSILKKEEMQTEDIAQSVKAEDSEDSEIMSLKVHDDQGFMIIEVLPDDDDDKREQQQPPDEIKPKIINKRANKSTVIQAHKKTQPLISDYFGFEVDEDEGDEETKGAIKLLEMIEQE